MLKSLVTLITLLITINTYAADALYYAYPDATTIPDTGRFLMYDSIYGDVNVTGSLLKTYIQGLQSGASGECIATSHATYSAAVASSSCTQIVLKGNLVQTSNITLSKPLTVAPGSTITTTGYTFNTAGLIVLPLPVPVFYGSGTVVGLKESRPEYFMIAGITTAVALERSLAAMSANSLWTANGDYDASDVTVTALSFAANYAKYTGTGIIRNIRITSSSSASGIIVDGLKVIGNRSNAAYYMFDFQSNNTTIQNCRFEGDGSSSTYAGYIRNVADFRFLNNSMISANGVYLEGHNIAVDGNYINEANGGDDGFVVKAIGNDSYNITVSNNKVVGASSIFSIGTEIGNAGSDTGQAVYNITVSNNVGLDCASVVLIKPGGGTTDYRNGIVRNVNIINNTLTDLSGTMYRAAIWFLPGRGATVKDIKVADLNVLGRTSSASVDSAGILITDVNTGNGVTIDNVTLSRTFVRDVYDGVANDGSHPGYPLRYGMLIQKNNAAATFGKFEVDDLTVRGSYLAGVITSTGITGPMIFNGLDLTYVVNNYSASTDNGFYAGSDCELKNVKRISTVHGSALPYLIPAGITVKGEEKVVSAGFLAAPGNFEVPLMASAQPVYIHKAHLVTNTSITQNDTDYVTLDVIEKGGGNNFISTTSKTTGGKNFTAFNKVALNTNSVNSASAYGSANEVFTLKVTGSGASRTVNGSIIVDYLYY